MRRLESDGISMPDDAREIVFPSAVPVQMLSEGSAHDSAESNRRDTLDDDSVNTNAEGDFSSESDELHQQANASRDPDDDEADLLAGSKSSNQNKDLAAAG